jgi:hypothetical protein
MADIVASEITEISRTVTNVAQGKKFQLLELSISHTFVNDDELTAAVIAGCRAIIAVLSITQMNSSTPVAVQASNIDTNFTVRASSAPSPVAADAGDAIIFPAAGTDSISAMLVWLLIESD